MSECLRYISDHSSLGDFIAVVSDAGLVAFEFADDREAVLGGLRARLANASFREDSEGLSGLAARLRELIEHPDSDPGVALDPRGDAYQQQVWSLLREIPPGETTSYGAVAARLGTRDARDVTQAIASNAIAILVPCHRVLKKDGSLSGYRWGARRKRALLEREARARRAPEAVASVR